MSSRVDGYANREKKLPYTPQSARDTPPYSNHSTDDSRERERNLRLEAKKRRRAHAIREKKRLDAEEEARLNALNEYKEKKDEYVKYLRGQIPADYAYQQRHNQVKETRIPESATDPESPPVSFRMEPRVFERQKGVTEQAYQPEMDSLEVEDARRMIKLLRQQPRREKIPSKPLDAWLEDTVQSPGSCSQRGAEGQNDQTNEIKKRYPNSAALFDSLELPSTNVEVAQVESASRSDGKGWMPRSEDCSVGRPSQNIRVESIESRSTPGSSYAPRRKNKPSVRPFVRGAEGREAVHASRWGKGAESDATRQRRMLREKAQAFASKCRIKERERARQDSEAGRHDALAEEAMQPGDALRIDRTKQLYCDEPASQKADEHDAHAMIDPLTLTMEEDKLLASLARLNVRLGLVKTGASEDDSSIRAALPAKKKNATDTGPVVPIASRRSTGKTNRQHALLSQGKTPCQGIVKKTPNSHLLLDSPSES